MKHNKQWNTFFAVERDIPYETHLRQTKELALLTAQSISYRQRISFGNMIAKQLKFSAPKIWTLQGIVLAALCACLFQFYGMGLQYDTADYYSLQRNSPKLLCLCSSIVVMSSIPLLLRSARYKMMELEQSTYFSIRGNLLAQLFFIGIGDLGMLSVLVFLAKKFQITHNTVFLSLVIPYLTAAVTCLMLWIRTAPASFPGVGMAACVLSSYLAYLAVNRSKILLAETSVYLWVIYAIACIGILCLECRKLYYQNAAEEMLP